MTALGCVTGRFQPVHRQHLDLFGVALAECDRLVVAVTNPDPAARRADPTSVHRHRPEANPFSYYERSRLLQAALDERGWTSRTTIVPFDLTRPDVWTQYVPVDACQYVRAYTPWERRKAELLAAADYPVRILTGDGGTPVRATDVRAALAGGRWRELVGPVLAPATEPLLAGYAERFGALR